MFGGVCVCARAICARSITLQHLMFWGFDVGRHNLGGRFGYFLFFFLLGEGEGGVRGAGRGEGRFLIQNPRRGGVSRRGRGRGCLRRIGDLGGEGANFFFFGAEMSTK